MGADVAAPIHFNINTKRSRFTIQAFAQGMLASFGHNPRISIRDFSGEIQVIPNHPESSKVQMKVSTGTLQVVDDVSEKDKKEIELAMKDEVLEASRFPEIKFESNEITGEMVFQSQYRVNITGNLTLHGVTRPLSLQAQVMVSEDQLRAQGDFQLRQTDFGLKLISVAGGTLKVKDEVKCTFDILGQLAPL